MVRGPYISPVADTLPAESGKAASEIVLAGELARGAPIGRYLVLEKIGAGGMGVVYAAYDPKLDRRIALKALSVAEDSSSGTSGRDWLAQEARAMARLSHPNVVAVYDVLTEGEQVLVAMELVEGKTLRAWLGEAKRGWREVIEVFLEAGRGLAAAHDAGLVHRDFKLDNVFVGDDGRVKVGDFGLARSALPAPELSTAGAPDVAESPAADPPPSRDELVVGTPVYMAPDQLRGAAADARSDQFSFCAAMHEGLYGVPPFEGSTLLSLVESMDSERLRAAPLRSDVPRWLRGIVARGLRRRPEDRFASMRELLTTLETDPAKARRRRVVALAGLAAGGLVAALWVHERHARAIECRAFAQRASVAWGGSEAGSVERAFVATGRPYAEDTFGRTAAALDGYARQWGAQAAASCEERAEGRAKGELPFERAECLEARLGDLRAFVGALGRADGETVERAVGAARALPSLEVCTSTDPLQGEPTPSDPAVRDRVRSLDEELRVAGALRVTGRVKESLAAATKGLADAEPIAFPPLTARVLLNLAQAQHDAGDVASAEETYRLASLAAERAGTWVTAAHALIGEAERAIDKGNSPLADDRLDHAEVWVDRSGDDLLRAQLLISRAEERSTVGKYDESRALGLQALALYERAGSDEAAEAMNQLGIVADMQRRYDEARDYYHRALDRYEKLLGPKHPKVASELNNLGLMEADSGNASVGISDLERSLAIDEESLGPEHPHTLETMSNISSTLSANDRAAEALVLSERAVPIVERVLGPDSLDAAFALGPLAIALLDVHRPADAIAPATKSLAIFERGGAPVNVADAQCDLGRAYLESGIDKVRGRTLLHEARAGFLAVGRTQRIAEIDEFLAGAK